MGSYCDFAREDPLHRAYHDREYGFPEQDEARLFERLMLEINQAGLSWALMLKKRENFRAAFDGFAVDKVARYGERERQRLLADAGIVRNRLKINAAIENAKRIQLLRDSHGSFAAWLAAQHPRPLEDWRKLFKKTFVFTGGEIVREFLLSIGYLPGAHKVGCPIQARILKLEPPWVRRGLRR